MCVLLIEIALLLLETVTVAVVASDLARAKVTKLHAVQNVQISPKKQEKKESSSFLYIERKEACHNMSTWP